MKGHPRRRGSGHAFVVYLGRQSARRCASGCLRVLVWHDDGRDTCPRCNGPLSEPTMTKRQSWSPTYKTAKERDREMHKALGRIDSGLDVFPERILAREFFEKWLQHLEVQDKPRRPTRHEYRRLTRTRFVPALGGLELAKIRPADCQAVIDTAAADGVKPTQLRAVMSSAFATALRWSLILVNPVRATTAPSKPSPKLTVPNAAELHKVVEASLGTVWEPAVLIAARCGTRRSETLAVTWDGVDLEHGTLRIDKSLQRIDGKTVFADTKTARSRRTIPLSADTVARLRARKLEQAQRRLRLGADWHDHNLVIERGDGAPLDPDAFTHAFARLAKSVGLDGVRLHDLRHGVASALAKAGTRPEVTSALMGHSSVSFTQSVYTHPDAESLEAAMRGLEALERETGP